MKTNLTCESIQNYLLENSGRLAEPSEMAEHLDQCPACQACRDAVKLAFATPLELPEPSSRLDARILAYAGARQQARQSAAASRRLHLHISPMVFRLALAASLVLLLSFAVRLIRPPQTTGNQLSVAWEQAALNQQLTELAGSVETVSLENGPLETLFGESPGEEETATKVADKIDTELYALNAEMLFMTMSFE